MAICVNCGAELIPGLRYCSVCGAPADLKRDPSVRFEGLPQYRQVPPVYPMPMPGIQQPVPGPQQAVPGPQQQIPQRPLPGSAYVRVPVQQVPYMNPQPAPYANPQPQPAP